MLSLVFGLGGITYAKEHDVVQDLVVESKVIAGDDVDAGVLLDLPVLEAEAFAFGEQVVARELAAPVGLGGLLQVTEGAHAGEAQNGRLDHDCGIGGWWEWFCGEGRWLKDG
jgi:hypothetical protein